MTTLTIELPDGLAKEAQDAGLLTSAAGRTIVKRGELTPGTFRNMLKQLDIPKGEF